MKNLPFIIIILLSISCQSNLEKEGKSEKKITIVAHRGASGYLPEHTLASKVMAYAMQADYIEQDASFSPPAALSSRSLSGTPATCRCRQTEFSGCVLSPETEKIATAFTRVQSDITSYLVNTQYIDTTQH